MNTHECLRQCADDASQRPLRGPVVDTNPFTGGEDMVVIAEHAVSTDNPKLVRYDSCKFPIRLDGELGAMVVACEVDDCSAIAPLEANEVTVTLAGLQLQGQCADL